MTAAQREVIRAARDQQARARVKRGGRIGADTDPPLRGSTWSEPLHMVRARSIFHALNVESGGHYID